MPVLRRLVGALTVASLAVLLSLGVLSHLAPLAGWQLVSIRGGSMEPSIPYGAMVAVHETVVTEVATGDVVTFRTTQGTLVTHRVIGISGEGSGVLLLVQGDANASADPAPVVGRQLMGRVEVAVPGLGFLLAALATPAGLLAALGWMGMLVLAGMALEDGRTVRRATRTADPLGDPAG
jgi:signal peptidase I